MKIHIIGAGPTGMSLAWEIIHSGEDHDITIYDKKTSAGGSWWEPETGLRDIHAHRVVFDKAFVNTRSLFEEMNINWNDVFEPSKDDGGHTTFLKNSLGVKDYGILLTLIFKVFTQPGKYRGISLKDAVGAVSEGAKTLLEHLPLIMDGVTWDVMSAYEFVNNLNHVALSKPYTQKGSGRFMCDEMENTLIEAGVNFVYDVEVENVEYMDDTYKASLSNNTTIDDGYLFLCIDNSPALKLLGDNWGPEADKKVRESTYGAINVLLDYNEPVKIKSDLEIAATTSWNLQPRVLSDGKTISCVICKITREILSNTPEMLKLEVIEQLGLPPPEDIRIGWGADWNENDGWTFSQSSGVLSLYGQLPFFGKCSKVAMCGMMSPRHTPYSSIESAVEVSRSLSHQCFGTRKPIKPFTVSQLVILLLMILIVIILVYRNRHQ